MTTTLSLHTEVPPNREILVTLPLDVPVGAADITVIVSAPAATATICGGLLQSEFFGVWSGRGDIDDSAAYARELRERAWKRAV